MKITAVTGCEEVAVVYIVDFGEGKLVECVEAVQPPIPREKKWVLLVSTMFGCPVGCMMCDAGGFYQGKLTKDQILAQIDFLVRKRYPDGCIPAGMFKIQFARMGEPALNPAVIEVLQTLPALYPSASLLPSLSTVAPKGCELFLERLIQVKERHYSRGRFQFQFSIHTTDVALRDRIVPVTKWSFEDMAAYGERFFQPGDRKITLNFALAKGNPLEAWVLRRYFDPDKFLVKITPLNPTHRSAEHNLATHINPECHDESDELVQSLREAGYQVIVSIGEVEENRIGSNCGQYVLRHLQAERHVTGGYTYPTSYTESTQG
ncbi:MAG: radical SAM protein [Chloroflexota bacterium]|nr:MAG: radical SAM protein [Chloroflexota bacterium]